MKSRHRILVIAFLCLALLSGGAWAFYLDHHVGTDVTAAGAKFVGLLDEGQKKKAVMAYDSAERVGWHFIPKATRKGLQLKEMTDDQKKAALALLQSVLSQTGYEKSTKIMSMETILDSLEQGKPNRNIRDTQRYYFTVFGTPASDSRWGLSIEGHHLSLNFVIEGKTVIASSPEMFGTNPAIVKSSVTGGQPLGTRILEKEETLGFDLLASLTPDQLKVAMIADKAPAEMRAAGEPQPPTDAPAGIAAAKLDEKQQKTLRSLIEVYCRNLPDEVAADRLAKLDAAGFEKIHFAWAGANKPGIGHYYRVQGPSFVVELVNTQPDAAGNIANHVHCEWRNLEGDFALPIKK